MIDRDKLDRLLLNLAEAKAVERREAEKLVASEAAHKQQQATWREANEAVNVHQKAIDEFVRTETIREADEINSEWKRD
jgi:hypothetical protein